MNQTPWSSLLIVITAATGQLGTLVVDQLLDKVPAASVRVAVRSPSKAAHWADKGVQVVHADYDEPDTLRAAFEGADKVLLISSSAIGQRARQHRNAIDAAVDAKVGLLVYTSLLKAETSHCVLADEHVPSENAIRASGLDFVLLRNGWYLENYTENLGAPLQTGAFYGAAGDGRIAAASRADFAAAAVTVLTEDGHAGKTYELAGESFTMADLAQTVGSVVDKELDYVDLPEEAYRKALIDAGVPEGMASVLANADTAISKGDLEAPTDDLVALIGRPPTPLKQAVRTGVAALS